MLHTVSYLNVVKIGSIDEADAQEMQA